MRPYAVTEPIMSWGRKRTALAAVDRRGCRSGGALPRRIRRRLLHAAGCQCLHRRSFRFCRIMFRADPQRRRRLVRGLPARGHQSDVSARSTCRQRCLGHGKNVVFQLTTMSCIMPVHHDDGGRGASGCGRSGAACDYLPGRSLADDFGAACPAFRTKWRRRCSYHAIDILLGHSLFHALQRQEEAAIPSIGRGSL